MKVIYSKVCGVDVHKSFIVAVICDSTTIMPKYLKKRFSTFNNSLIKFRDWLIDNDCQNVCMESTALTVGNCKLDIVFSDIFGKSSQSIVDIIMNNDNFSDEDIISCINVKCKSSHDDILSSVNGINFTNEQKLRINIIKEHIDYLTNQINSLRESVNTLVAPCEDYINLLMTIPGIDRNSAITIISEIGVDMSQFSNQYRLSAWAGLAPGCNESVGKKKSVKISRAGVFLKPCLVEVAHCVVKDKTNTYYADKFNRISKRRGKKRACIAIARKILVAIYHILSTGEVWNPRDLASVETSDKDRIKYTKNNFCGCLKQLLSLGLTSEEIINIVNQNAQIE